MKQLMPSENLTHLEKASSGPKSPIEARPSSLPHPDLPWLSLHILFKIITEMPFLIVLQRHLLILKADTPETL